MKAPPIPPGRAPTPGSAKASGSPEAEMGEGARQKTIMVVTPAEAGVQRRRKPLDSGFRQNDVLAFISRPPRAGIVSPRGPTRFLRSAPDKAPGSRARL